MVAACLMGHTVEPPSPSCHFRTVTGTTAGSSGLWSKISFIWNEDRWPEIIRINVKYVGLLASRLASAKLSLEKARLWWCGCAPTSCQARSYHPFFIFSFEWRSAEWTFANMSKAPKVMRNFVQFFYAVQICTKSIPAPKIKSPLPIKKISCLTLLACSQDVFML